MNNNNNILTKSSKPTFALDKLSEKWYTKNSITQTNLNAFDNDATANSALDYLYSNDNLNKTQSFLKNNGFPSAQEREYNKELYGIQEEQKNMQNLLKNKTNSILNPTLPNDTDRAFLKGLMGEEEEERDYQNQVSSASRAQKDFQNTFQGTQFESILNSNKIVPSEKQSPLKALTTTSGNSSLKSNLEYPDNSNQSTQLALAQLSDVSKEKSGNGIFSKGYNNHIYTSKYNHYTEKVNGKNGFFNKDCYYAEKDGKRYRANSHETVDYPEWNSIDTDFLKTTFVSLINEANKTPTDIKRIFTESIDGDLDFKNQLDEKKLYLINGILYNKNEAGNFMWAYFLESKNFPGYLSGILAQGGSLWLEKRLDEEWDMRARWAGVKYYYEKNNMLWLYYHLYGGKIKY